MIKIYKNIAAVKPPKSDRRTSVLVGRLFFVRLGEPGEEGFGSLAHLLGGADVDVLLAGPAAPFGDDFLADQVLFIVEMENLDDLLENVGMCLAESAKEPLGTTQKGSLVALGRHDLPAELVGFSESEAAQQDAPERLAFCSMLLRLGIWAQICWSKMVCTRTKTVRCLASMPKSIAFL